MNLLLCDTTNYMLVFIFFVYYFEIASALLRKLFQGVIGTVIHCVDSSLTTESIVERAVLPHFLQPQPSTSDSIAANIPYIVS